jgi:uncharacterized membrane protein
MGSELESRVAEHLATGINAARRAILSVAAGLVLSVPVLFVAGFEFWVLIAWDMCAAIYIGSVWLTHWKLDSRATARAAEREDPTRHTVDVVLISAAVISLSAVVFALVRSSSGSGATRALAIALSIGTILCSWVLVNTVYALKYSRLYYEGDNGGIDFHQDEDPAYSDFAYVAFTVGMTFQLSDTDVSDSRMRKAVLAHSILAFVFGTGILAAALNLLGNVGPGG